MRGDGVVGPDTTALVALVDAADPAVARHLEGVVGWQVVSSDDPLVRPRIAVVDPRATTVPAGLPTVLVVGRDDDPAVAARAGRRADAILAWPDSAADLPGVVAGLIDQPREHRVPTLAIAASAGGVGATTVTLAVAALASWDLGASTLALVCGWSPVPGAPPVAAGDLGAPSLWNSAAVAAGVQGVRVARLDRPVGEPSVVADVRGPDRVVVEAAGPAADLLVVRPDGAGRDAVTASAVGTVVMLGDGPVSVAAMVRAAQGRRVVHLPNDPRISRAGLAGRIPADLPGRWLDTLRDALR